MKKNYVIGLMSGTSMDGINASLVNTDGRTLNRTGYQVISSYSEKTIKLLKKYVFHYDILKNNISILKKIQEDCIGLDHLMLKDFKVVDMNMNGRADIIYGDCLRRLWKDLIKKERYITHQKD